MHGREIKQNHNPNAPDCADCHKAHNVKRTSSSLVKLAITDSCGSCHDIEPSSTPVSKMHMDKRLESCQECHSGKKDIPLATWRIAHLVFA